MKKIELHTKWLPSWALYQATLLLLCFLSAPSLADSQIFSHSNSFGENFRLIDSEGFARLFSSEGTEVKSLLVAIQPSCHYSASFYRWAATAAQENNISLTFLNAERPQNREKSQTIREDRARPAILMDYSQTISKGFHFKNQGDFILFERGTWSSIAKGNLFHDSHLIFAHKNSLPLGLRISKFIATIRGTTKTCSIDYQQEPISNSKLVTATLAKACLHCHHKIKSVDYFKNYQDVKNWHEMNRTVMRLFAMPFAGLDYESTLCSGAGYRSPAITESDLSLLANWIEGGEPGFRDKDLIAESMERLKKIVIKPPKEKPDIVWEMKTRHTIPAKGEVLYEFYSLAGPLKEPMLIVAASMEANFTVAHHAHLLITDAPLSSFNAKTNPLPGMGAYTDIPSGQDPNADIALFSLSRYGKFIQAWPGTAYYIPKGKYVILQHHYEPSGKLEVNRSKINIYLAKKEDNLKPIYGERVLSKAFTLKPIEGAFKNVDSWTAQEDSSIINITQHGHHRNIRNLIEAEIPGKEKKVVCNVPYHRLKSEAVLSLRNPLYVPKGTKLIFTQYFDNSQRNPMNPDPKQTIVTGKSEEFDEMAISRIMYVSGKAIGAVDLAIEKGNAARAIR